MMTSVTSVMNATVHFLAAMTVFSQVVAHRSEFYFEFLLLHFFPSGYLKLMLILAFSCTDVFDPFAPTRSLSQVLNMMDQFMKSPFLSASRGMGGGLCRTWDAKETEDALNFRIDMPGLGKEDVKVSVEQNTLVIEGEAKESDEEENGPMYTSRIRLPENVYKTHQINAEMKNGVLKVVVPKMKEEERNDVIQVQID